MLENIFCRDAVNNDLEALHLIADQMHARHERDYFERCLREQQEKKRDFIVAEQEAGELLGYVQLIWQPLYPLFRKLDIPEIQDLNVIPAAREQGIGSKLVDCCEERVLRAGKAEIGIGVGLNSSYGAAQRLYIKKSYIPDGFGVCYDDEPLPAGAMRAVDDLLTLKLTKKLS